MKIKIEVTRVDGEPVSDELFAEALKALPSALPSGHKWYCLDCRAENPDLFMVHDAIWAATAEPDEILCLDCVERRIGRPLTGNDFKDVPLNKAHVVEINDRVVEIPPSKALMERLRRLQ